MAPQKFSRSLSSFENLKIQAKRSRNLFLAIWSQNFKSSNLLTHHSVEGLRLPSRHFHKASNLLVPHMIQIPDWGILSWNSRGLWELNGFWQILIWVKSTIYNRKTLTFVRHFFLHLDDSWIFLLAPLVVFLAAFSNDINQPFSIIFVKIRCRVERGKLCQLWCSWLTEVIIKFNRTAETFEMDNFEI